MRLLNDTLLDNKITENSVQRSLIGGENSWTMSLSISSRVPDMKEKWRKKIILE